MLEIFEKIYKKLEVLDLNLMLSLQSHIYLNMGVFLKQRNQCFGQLEELFKEMSQTLSDTEMKVLRETHLKAQSRHQQIIAELRNVRQDCQNSMVRGATQQCRTSLYLKKPARRRIMA